MERSFVHFIPLATTLLSVVFGAIIVPHAARKKWPAYLTWWTLGVVTFGAGTLVESLTSLLGWNPGLFRAWYIAGALLGGAPLAQGTVYLLLRKRMADILSAILVAVIVVASVCALLTPLTPPAAADAFRLSGSVMAWQWVRAFSPFINIYAFVFLCGGAVWSAWQYRREPEARSRYTGNILIAVGALLPGIGGSFTRFGHVEVLYVTEFVGLALILAGYLVIRRDRSASVHAVQTTASVPFGLHSGDGASADAALAERSSALLP